MLSEFFLIKSRRWLIFFKQCCIAKKVALFLESSAAFPAFAKKLLAAEKAGFFNGRLHFSFIFDEWLDIDEFLITMKRY